MDMQQILQLAKDNSTFAVKKFERKVAKTKENESGVSSSAVASFLEKKRLAKEKIEAAEKLARQKRIQARLNPKPVEKKSKDVKGKEEKKVTPKEDKDDIRFKVDKNYKKEEHVEKKKKVEPENHIKVKHKESVSQSKIERNQNKIQRDKSYKNEHRKEVHRMDDKLEISRNSKNVKPDNSSKNNNNKNTNSIKTKKQSTPNNGLSFLELMKLAQNNAKTASTTDDPHRLNIQKKIPIEKKKVKKEHTEPEPEVKMKKKEKIEVKSPTEPKQKRMDQDSKQLKKEKLEKLATKNELISKSSKSSNRPENSSSSKSSKKSDIPSSKLSNKSESKCSLIAETISNTKSVIGSKSIPYPSAKPAVKTAVSKPLMKRKADQFNGRGIAAQNKSVPARSSARDYEDEFEKEERELLRRRRMLEMQRKTGNRNISEEDFYDDYDGYDDDYDDEDDDFIDDSEANIDTSKYIRKIFGYDRRKYDGEEEDISNMEASYSQIEKEEIRSARIAKIEDEYEAMKEEEELMRKRAKKKKK